MRTIREAKVGPVVVRLVQRKHDYAGVVIDGSRIKEQVCGHDADDVWRMSHDAAARLNPLFVGYAGARSRFLRFFPDGFQDAGYERHERTYKLEAKKRLEAAAPLEHAASHGGLGEAVLAVYRATNLLSPFEKTRLTSALRGPNADAIVQAAAAFAKGDTRQALKELKDLLTPHDSAKWTVATYLPFLWKPDEHFFLKPTMVRSFAERVGHRFADAYSAALDEHVYLTLLELAAETRAKIVDLKPQDMIDIQSFMWTSVEYTVSDRHGLT